MSRCWMAIASTMWSSAFCSAWMRSSFHFVCSWQDKLQQV